MTVRLFIEILQIVRMGKYFCFILRQREGAYLECRGKMIEYENE